MLRAQPFGVVFIVAAAAVPAPVTLDAGQARWQVEPEAADFDRWAGGTWDPASVPRLNARDFRRVAEDLKTHGRQWIQADGPGAEQRRRLQVATFVLDFLLTQDVAYTWPYGSPVLDLFIWARDLIGHGPPTEAGKHWLLASTALLQRCGVPLAQHAQVALSQFPNEPRFILARALAEEHRTWPQARDQRPLTLDQQLFLQLQARYREAAAVPAVSAEARIRLGHLELRRGRVAEALALFDAAGQPTERWLQYQRHLFAGQAHDRLGNVMAAEQAFAAALAAVPHAQSATLARASALQRMGRGAEAAGLMEQMLQRQAVPDPWHDFVHSEWRHFDTDMATLRRLVRP